MHSGDSHRRSSASTASSWARVDPDPAHARGRAEEHGVGQSLTPSPARRCCGGRRRDRLLLRRCRASAASARTLYRQQRGFDVVYPLDSRRQPPTPRAELRSARTSSQKYTNYHQGMVLITGPAGCGKSSTMAALVNLINEERDEHILTIEDPIEVIHPLQALSRQSAPRGCATQAASRARSAGRCARTRTSS